MNRHLRSLLGALPMALLILLCAWALIYCPHIEPWTHGAETPTPVPRWTRIVGTLTLRETPTVEPHVTVETLPTTNTDAIQKG